MNSKVKIAHLLDRFLQLTCWICPLLLALWFFFPTRYIITPADGGWYMSMGLNLAQGRGYTALDGTPVTERGPIFPLWLALFFKWFGASIPSAFVAARIFYVLNAVIVYFVGTKLYNRWAGLAASLLVLTSVTLSNWSTFVHLDHIFPFFVLLYLLVLLWALDRQKLWQFALSGFTLGATYLLKETALMFLPLPILLWSGIKAFRRRPVGRGVGVALLAFFITVLPWWLYAYLIKGEFAPLGPETGTSVYNGLVESAKLWRLSSYGYALVRYYREIMVPNFGLAPLFAAAWVAIVILAFVGSRPAKILSFIGLCFLPALVVQGLVGFRARQGMVFFILSYLVLVGVVWEAIRAIRARWSWGELSFQSLAAFLWVALTAGLLFGQVKREEGKFWNYAQRYDSRRFLKQGWNGIEVTGWHTPEVRQAGQWLLQHAKVGTPLLSGYQFKTAVHFFTEGKFPFYDLPTLCAKSKWEALCTEPLPGLDRRTVLFLWPDSGADVYSLAQYDLLAFTEEELLAAIRKNAIRYVLVTERNGFETLYFEHSPAFRLAANFGGASTMFKIYEVVKIEPGPFQLHIAKSVPQYLGTLRQEIPAKYQMIREEFLHKKLGLSNEQISGIEASKYPSW
jgi:4-amino-4-deoxy-L-arabinose transferase-like glycosyltransferase